jgi:ATP-dependent Lon protease
LRAGIDNVIIPRLNQKDLFDLPEEVKTSLRFTLAETVDDVLSASLEQPDRLRHAGTAESYLAEPVPRS